MIFDILVKFNWPIRALLCPRSNKSGAKLLLLFTICSKLGLWLLQKIMFKLIEPLIADFICLQMRKFLSLLIDRSRIVAAYLYAYSGYYRLPLPITSFLFLNNPSKYVGYHFLGTRLQLINLSKLQKSTRQLILH